MQPHAQKTVPELLAAIWDNSPKRGPFVLIRSTSPMGNKGMFGSAGQFNFLEEGYTDDDNSLMVDMTCAARGRPIDPSGLASSNR